MARASSVISVAITGDSKKLQGALRSADKGVAGFGKSIKGAALGIGTALAGIFAVSKAFDFVQGAITEADRLGDSVSNLNRIIGKTNTGKLQATANAFLDLGLSSQDVLELSVGFARIARTVGISGGTIAHYADDVSAVAQALSLTDEKGRGASEWVTIISKAAAKPNFKTFQALGLDMKKINKEATALALKQTGKKTAKSLTDAQLAAARLKIILRELNPVIDETLKSPDVELGQKQVGARIEELQGQLGTAISPVIADILQNLVDISKSEWVDTLVTGIETLQGKHEGPQWFKDLLLGIKTIQATWDVFVKDFPIDDLKTGLATVQATWDVTVGEWSDDIKELQDAFTVQLPAGIQVAADALTPLTDAVRDVSKFAGEASDNMFGLMQAILDMVARVASPLGNLRDVLEAIAGLLGTPTPTGSGTTRTGARPRGLGGASEPTRTDREIAAAVQRQRIRNGLGQ